MTSARRIPNRYVDAVENPPDVSSAFAQQSAQAHAALIALDLDGIGRRHRCYSIGELQTRLEKANRAIVLDSMEGERVGGQADGFKKLAWESALISEIVNGHDAARPRSLAIVQVRMRKPGLPIVRVNHVRRK